MREQAFFQSGDEDRVELEPLGRMHRHQLDRVLAGLGLVVTRFERRMGQEGGQRAQRLAAVGLDRPGTQRPDY